MKKLLLSAAILSIVSPSFAMMAGDEDRDQDEKAGSVKRKHHVKTASVSEEDWSNRLRSRKKSRHESSAKQQERKAEEPVLVVSVGKRIVAPKLGGVETEASGAIDVYCPPIKSEQRKQEGLKPMPGVIGF